MSVIPHSVDVAVVGGGLAGWIAATAAHEAGARTLLIERSPRPEGDGNSVISGGALHANLRDPRSPPEELVDTIMQTTGGEARRDVATAWAANAARTTEWIEGHGGALMTDSRYSHRAKVFSPVKPTVPGLAASHYGTARFLVALAAAFRAAGGTILQPARATDLRRAGERWQVVLDDGSLVEARAVVFADGGFQADRALIRAHVGTDRYKLRATAMSVGDTLRMGLANGAATAQMRGFYGHLLHRASLERDDVWPYPILDLLAAVGAVVGPDGRRLVDESISGVRTTNAVAWSAHPDGCWLLFDSAAWEGEGRIGETPPNPYLAGRGLAPLSAPTLAALAGEIGVDAVALAATAAELAGGATAASPPRRGPVRLDAAPFFAIPIVAGISFTFGGLAIDGDARVLAADGGAIDGLYAAGGAAAGLHGGPDVGYAGGLLEAAVFGLIAGEQAGRSVTG